MLEFISIKTDNLHFLLSACHNQRYVIGMKFNYKAYHYKYYWKQNKIKKIIGIILIIIGIAMAATGSFSFQQKKKIIDTDVIDISKRETKTVVWPRIAGVFVIVGGMGMLLLSGKRR